MFSEVSKLRQIQGGREWRICCSSVSCIGFCWSCSLRYRLSPIAQREGGREGVRARESAGEKMIQNGGQRALIQLIVCTIIMQLVNGMVHT